MKYVRTGKLQPNALKRLYELQPKEEFNNEPLKRIEILLTMLQEDYPQKLQEFISNLISKYESLVNEEGIKKYPLSDVLLEDKPTLNENPRVAEYILNYYLHLLQMSDTPDWTTNTIKTPQRNYFRSFLLPRYQNLQALIKTLGRNEAIKLYKKYISYFFTQLGKPDKSDFINLTQHYEKVSQSTSPPSEWVTVRGLMNNGKYFFMNENCLWVDALIDIEDKELMYLICCYGDYQSIQRNYNQHIILTMEHTIAQGDAYCSRVLHDTREDWDLRHPKKEFWDELHNQP